MRNTDNELSSIIGGRHPYEPDPDQITQSDIFGAAGQVAKQYAMEPINLVDRFSRYLEGERSGHLIKVGNQWIDREAWDLSQQIGGELMGGGMGVAQVAPSPQGSLGVFAGRRGMERRIEEMQHKITKEDVEIDRLNVEADELWEAGKSEEAIQKVQQVYEKVKPRMEETKPGKMRTRLEDAIERLSKLKSQHGKYIDKEIPYNELDQIRAETGWFKPSWYRRTPVGDRVDDAWRFEIDDSKLRVKQTELGETKFDYFSNRVNQKGGSAGTTLENVVEHDELFEMYPELKKYKVAFEEDSRMNGALGAYNPDTKTFKLNTKNIENDQIGVLLHEIQHAVQDFEGFSRGSNLDVAQEELSSIRDHRFVLQKVLDAKTMGREPSDKIYKSYPELKDMSVDAIQDRIDTIDVDLMSYERSQSTPTVARYKADPGEQEARSVELRYRLFAPNKEEGKFWEKWLAEHPGKVSPEADPYGMAVFVNDPETGDILDVFIESVDIPERMSKAGEAVQKSKRLWERERSES